MGFMMFLVMGGCVKGPQGGLQMLQPPLSRNPGYATGGDSVNHTLTHETHDSTVVHF